MQGGKPGSWDVAGETPARCSSLCVGPNSLAPSALVYGFHFHPQDVLLGYFLWSLL